MKVMGTTKQEQLQEAPMSQGKPFLAGKLTTYAMALSMAIGNLLPPPAHAQGEENLLTSTDADAIKAAALQVKDSNPTLYAQLGARFLALQNSVTPAVPQKLTEEQKRAQVDLQEAQKELAKIDVELAKTEAYQKAKTAYIEASKDLIAHVEALRDNTPVTDKEKKDMYTRIAADLEKGLGVDGGIFKKDPNGKAIFERIDALYKLLIKAAESLVKGRGATAITNADSMVSDLATKCTKFSEAEKKAKQIVDAAQSPTPADSQQTPSVPTVGGGAEKGAEGLASKVNVETIVPNGFDQSRQAPKWSKDLEVTSKGDVLTFTLPEGTTVAMQAIVTFTENGAVTVKCSGDDQKDLLSRLNGAKKSKNGETSVFTAGEHAVVSVRPGAGHVTLDFAKK